MPYATDMQLNYEGKGEKIYMQSYGEIVFYLKAKQTIATPVMWSSYLKAFKKASLHYDRKGGLTKTSTR